MHQPRPEHLGGPGQRHLHRLVVVPGRGLVRPLRHLGARRHDQGAGRRRHRADARGGRPRARARPRRGAAAPRRRRPCSPTPCSACATPRARPPCGSRPAPTPRSSASSPPARCATYVTPSADLPLLVERELALSGAWYELFPRSEGATYDEKEHRWTTGTLRTAAKRLPAIAAMGFDVVYLTPVHPIGQAAKKGPNNTLDARPEDPGSPYAIGSADGGHDAIHPDLGTFDGLRRLRGRVRAGSAWRSPWTSRCSAPPTTPGSRPTPSGSPPAPTAPSPTPRTRRRSTRTSTRSTSTTTPPASTPRCARSCRCGSTTGSPCSGSTTRTPSRWSSGSG